MSLFQCSKPRAVPWVAMTFLVAWLSPLTGFQVLVGTCPLESWVQMGYIGASSGESTWVWPCLSQTSVFGKLLLVFSNNAPRKLFLFLFSLSHHYTEEISLIESIASIRVVTASEVAWSMRARREWQESRRQGDLVVLSTGRERFCCLCIYTV